MVNKQYERLFHITQKEIIGKTDYDIFPKKRAGKFQENDRTVLNAKVPMEFEEIAPHKDGLHTYISIKFPLSTSDNKIYGVCGISTDITERKRYEKKLKRTQQKILLSSIEIYRIVISTMRSPYMIQMRS